MFTKGDNYSASKRAQSSQGGNRSELGSAPAGSSKKDALFKSKKATFGLDVAELKRWKKENTERELGQESAKQEIAVAKVKGFLDAIATAVHVQSWWRMTRVRREYNRVMNERKSLKRRCYRSWKIYWKSERLHLFHVLGKFFQSWRDEIRDEKRLKKTIAGFFAICIKRMKLTPQAIMAFFNPGEWSDVVAVEDKMKIRRMVLLKLFYAWKNESRDLKIMRYKATQILSRMVRRTKGPLWVKESTLVCFHMWHRYTVVKNCYRRGELDPTFKNPYLPQWAKLYKDITLSRVKKKRTLETGQLLTQRRAYVKWRYLMTVDRSKPVTPLAVAINHYHTALSTKIVRAWYQFVRERGRAMRYAEKIFYAWQQWAPKHRKLRQFNDIATEWVRLQRVRRSFNVMTKICETMISMRSEKIKELRKIFCDRKIVICAYALLNKNEHVMMVDCWRKLVCYWKGRRRWKALNWHFNYGWFTHKAREILHAWRTAAVVRREARLRGDVTDDISVESYLTSIDHASIGGDSALDALFAHLSGKDEQTSVMSGFWDEGNRLFYAARVDKQTLKPGDKEFLFMCLMWSKYWTQIQSFASLTSEEFSRTILHDPKHSIERTAELKEGGSFIPKNLMPLLETSASSVAASSIASTAPTFLNPTNQDNFNHVGLGVKAPYNQLYKELWNPDKQAKLQKSIDYALLPEVCTILNEMPLYESKFLKQLLGHLGDHYIPLFALMLMGSVCFIAERMIKKDKNTILLQCHSPINAFILGSQLTRWEKIDLTTREIAMLTQDPILTDMNAGRYRSVIMWRLVFLHSLDNRCLQMACTCRTLPVTRSMETEVAEVLKRNKVTKVIALYRSIATSLGCEPEWTVEERIAELIPPLLFDSTRKTIVVSTDEYDDDPNNTDSTKKKKNIYQVLREYLLLTGKLAKEAKALRDPLMERDQKLIVSGFLKQARKDYLALRRECMTKKEIEAEKEKAEKEREKQLRIQRKAEAKTKARRKAAKLKKKKDAKAMLKASLSESAKTNTSFGDTADLDGEEGGGDGGEGAETGDDTGKEGEGGETDNNNLLSPGEGAATSFDERDFDKSRSSIIRELFDELSLVEESEIFDERDFQERVGGLESPVYIETWLPSAWIQDKVVRENYENKLKRELRLALKRVFFVMQHQDAFGPFNYQFVRTQFQGVGMFMIDTVLGDNTPTQPYRNSPLWLVVPKEYWSFRQVKERMFREQAFIDGLVNGMKDRLETVETANEQTDKDISQYQKFLKKVRKQVVDIAQKQVQKEVDDEKEKATKIQQIKKTEKSIAANNRKIHAINEKIRLADIMIAGSNLEGVYELLKPPLELDENGNPIVKKKEEPHTTASIMQMVEDVKQKAQDTTKSIKDLEEKKRKMESELQAYNMYCARATKLLKSLAEDRFNTMIDLQLLTNRVSKNLDSAEVEELEMKKFRKFNNKYLRALQYFFDDNIANRGMQLTKEAEIKKIQELMNRPTIITVSTPNAVTTSAGLREGIDVRKTMSLDERGPPSPASQQRSLSSKHIKTDPTIPARRTGMMASFNLEDKAGDAVLEEGSEEASLQPEVLGGSTKLEPLPRGASTISYENTESSVASSVAQRLKNQSGELPQQDSFIGFGQDDDEEEPIIEIPVSSKVEPASSNRALTIEEEIELLHYNSPENIAKREEELRQLALQKAEELQSQELRMKIFDDYWSSYPRKELPVDYSIKKKEKPVAPKPVVEYIEPAKRVIRTRSERMWKSVGEAYWRTKREHIENLIRAQGDLSGLDPESIADVVMKRRGSIDPLDFEFDLLPDTIDEEENEDDEHPKFQTPAQQFIEPFHEMGVEIWQSPVRPTSSHGQNNKDSAPSMSISMKKLPKFPMKTGEMPTTNIASALFNPDTAVALDGPPMSFNPDAINRDMVSAQELALLGEDPPRQKGSRERAKPKTDPFAMTGASEFKRIREGITGRGLRSINMFDNEFSVSTRTGGQSLAGYITLEDRSDSSTFYQLKADTLLEKKKAQKMQAMNGGNNAVLSPIKSSPGSPGSREGSVPNSRDGSNKKPGSRDASVRSRTTTFDDEDDYEGDAEGDVQVNRQLELYEEDDEDGDEHSENSTISSHQHSNAGTHSSSVEHRRQVAEYLDMIEDNKANGGGLVTPSEGGDKPTTSGSGADTHLTDAQKRSQRFREFKEKRTKRPTFANTTGTDLLKATMLLTQQKEKQQQQMDELKKAMLSKMNAERDKMQKRRNKRRNSTMSTGTDASEASNRSRPAPVPTPAPTKLSHTASAEIIALARSRQASEENSLNYSSHNGSLSVYSEFAGSPSVPMSRADSEVMSVGSSMHKSLQRSVRYLEEHDELLNPPGTTIPLQPQQLPPPEDLSFSGHQYVAVRAKDGNWSLVPSTTLPVPFIKDRGSPSQLFASAILGGIPVDDGPLLLEGKSAFQPIPVAVEVESEGSSQLDPEILKNFRLIHTLGLPEKMSDSLLSYSNDDGSVSMVNLMDLVHDFKEKQDLARQAKEDAELRARFSPTKEQQIAEILKQYQKPISFVPAYFRQNRPASSSADQGITQGISSPFPLMKEGSGIKFTDEMVSGEASRDLSPIHSRTASMDADDVIANTSKPKTPSDGIAMNQHLLRVVGEHIETSSPSSIGSHHHHHNSGKVSTPPSFTMRVSIPTPKLLEDRLLEADNNAVLNSKRTDDPVHPGTSSAGDHLLAAHGDNHQQHHHHAEGARTTPVIPKLFREISDNFSETSDYHSDEITVSAAHPVSDTAVRDMANQLRDYIKSRERVMKERQILHERGTGSPGKLRIKESTAQEIRYAEDQTKNHYSENLPRSPASPLHPFRNSNSLSPNNTKRRASQQMPSEFLQQQQPPSRVMFDSAVTWFEPVSGAYYADELHDLDGQQPEGAVLVKQPNKAADFWIDVSKTAKGGGRNSPKQLDRQPSMGTPVAMVIPNTPLHMQLQQQQVFPLPAQSASQAEKPRRTLKEDREGRSLGPKVVLKAKKLSHPQHEHIPEDRFLASYKRVSRIINRSLTSSELQHLSELDPYDNATKELANEMIQGVAVPLVGGGSPTNVAADKTSAGLIGDGTGTLRSHSNDEDQDEVHSIVGFSVSGVPMIPLAMHQHRQHSPPALHQPKLSGRYNNSGTTPRTGNSARSNSAAAMQIINEIAGEQYRMGDTAVIAGLQTNGSITALTTTSTCAHQNTSSTSAASILSTTSAATAHVIASTSSPTKESLNFASSFPSFADVPLVTLQDGGSLVSQGSSAFSPNKRSVFSTTSSMELAAFAAPQLIPSAPSNYHLVPDDDYESPWASTAGNSFKAKGKGSNDVIGLQVVATSARVSTKPVAAVAAAIATTVGPKPTSPSKNERPTSSAKNIMTNIDQKNDSKQNFKKDKKENSISGDSSKIASGVLNDSSSYTSIVAKRLEDQIELSRLASPYIDPTVLVSTPRAKTPHSSRADAINAQLDRALALNSVPITPSDHDLNHDNDSTDAASVEQHIKVKINRADDQVSKPIMNDEVDEEEDQNDEEDDEEFEDNLNEELRNMLRSESAPASLHTGVPVGTAASASFSSLKKLVAASKHQQTGNKPYVSMSASASAPQITSNPSSSTSQVGQAQFPPKLETGVKIPGHNPQSGFVPNSSNASKNPFHGVKRKKQLQLPPLLSPAPAAVSVTGPVISLASTMPAAFMKSNTEGFNTTGQSYGAMEFSSTMPISKVTPQVKGKVNTALTTSTTVEAKKKAIDPSLRGAHEAYLQLLQQSTLDSHSISIDSKVSAISVKMERKSTGSASMPNF